MAKKTRREKPVRKRPKSASPKKDAVVAFRRKLKDLAKVQQAELDRLKTSRRNRILRRAGPSEVWTAAARVRARVDARERQLAAAVKKARIGKRDHGRTVIFDTAGRRYADLGSVPVKTKVYMIRVGPRGGRRMINPDDPDTIMKGVKAQPMPLTRRDFRFDKLVRIAPKKFREEIQGMEQQSRSSRALNYRTVSRAELEAQVERTAPVDIGRDGDIEKFYLKAKRAYVDKVRSEEDLTSWGFEMLVSLRGQKGVIRPMVQQLPAHNFFKVVPARGKRRRIVYRNNSTSAKALQWSIEAAVNEAVRAELRVRGLVSQGSATRISRLPHNKGLAKAKWRDKNGARWKGAGLETVSIKRIQFRLFRII